MNMTAQLATFEEDGRRAERKEVLLGAGLRQRGAHSVTVQVIDLSVTGFRAATHLQLFEGQDIWVKLPGLESIHSRVVWMKGHMIGAEFARPLHPAVLAMVARNTPGG
jgi:hypothetical protein